MATKPMRVDGVDISHFQDGKLDLAGAKKRGVKFLYHKATEGTSFVDGNFARRRAEAAKAGIPFGGYHFARAKKGNAAAEAKHFLDVVKPKPGDLRPALDLETTEGLSMADLRTWAKTFIAAVEKATGVKPIIYSPFDLGSAVKGCLLWRPRYNNSNARPTLRYDIWQFSNGVFGVPNNVPGIGHVDINTMRDGLKVSDMQIPKAKHVKPPKQPRVDHLDVMHASLQFSVSDKFHTADIEKIFTRAKAREIAWITGTEAGTGSGNTPAELTRVAKASGYRLWCPSAHPNLGAAKGSTTDCWIAVREDLIKGNWEQGFDPIIPGSRALYNAQGLDGDKTFPRWGTKGLVRVAFDSPFGRIHVGAAHYLTKARDPQHATVKGVNHWEWNKKLGDHISEWAVANGKGSAKVFYGGDQNMADARNTQPQGDSFFGGPLTSAADELEHWENSGHGPIDVIASYDKDGAVSATYFRALSDKEFPLHVDHFLCEAGYDVKRKRA